MPKSWPAHRLREPPEFDESANSSFRVDVDHQYQMEIRRHSALDQQRNILHQNRVGFRRVDQFLRALSDQGMSYRIQLLPGFFVGECAGRERGPIQAAVRRQDLRSERLRQRREALGAGRDDLARDGVGIDDHRAPFGQDPRHRRLTRSHASGEADPQHAHSLAFAIPRTADHPRADAVPR